MTTPANIAHLHNHTAHSPLDGISKLDDLIAAAAADHNPALAITDHGTLAGTWNFAKAAHKAGIKPILGMEAYLSIGRRHEHNHLEVPNDAATDGSDDGTQTGTKVKRYQHLTLLAATEQGWSNLQYAALEAENTWWYKPRLDFDLLGSTRQTPTGQVRVAHGMIAGTGCLGGPVAGPLLAGDYATARANTALMVDLFGPDGVFVEVMDHGIPAERQVIGDLVKIANEFSLPVVATNDAHYVHADQAHAHDVWLCVGENQRTKAGKNVRVDDTNRFRFNGTGYHLRTAAEMHALFGNQPGTENAVANTLLIAERVSDNVFGTIRTRLPRYRVPDGHTTSAEYLHKLVLEGARRRYGTDTNGTIQIPASVAQRLRAEFDTITAMGFEDYFLIEHDIVDWAKSDRGLPTDRHPDGEPGRKRPILIGPGRGSAAGSCVLFCLGVTNVEPLESGLLFERFLDPSRDDLPDVDTDIQASRREEVVAYIRSRFGSDYVARIGTWTAAWSKRAIKDVARVTDRTPLANTITKTIHIQGKPEDTPLSLMRHPERLKDGQPDAGIDLRQLLDTNPDAADLVDLAEQVEGVVSGESIHACGIVIGDEPLPGLIPMRMDRRKNANPDDTVTAWEAHGVSDFGLVKFDWLFLNDLDSVDTCVQMITDATGEHIDVYNLPKDPNDPRVQKTWDLLAAGKTAGVFQLAGDGITDLTRKVRPSSTEDLSSILALFRPGPMAAGMHEAFVRRRNGTEPVDYSMYTPDPAEQSVIREVLNPTLATVTYQEQLMELGRSVADFQPAQTNRLRRAFSKKNQTEMDAVRDMWIAGGMSPVRSDGTPKVPFRRDTLETLWVTFDGSAKYLFNKCLTGDTVVVVGSGTGAVSTTIEALYRRIHGTPDTPDGVCPHCGENIATFKKACTRCQRYLTVFRHGTKPRLLAFDTATQKLRMQPLEDIHCNGVRSVYTVTLSGGRTVTATGNHRFLGDKGYMRVDDLTTGDQLLVQACDRSLTGSATSKTTRARVETVEPAGTRMTFDVEMGPGSSHTFLANGIVSHNSHSAGYGEVTYMTAYLKANYPAFFGAALLGNVEPTNREKRSAMLRSLRADGVTVLGPSANFGHAATAVDSNGAVRIGMTEVVGGGDNARWVEDARRAGGPFTSLTDLSTRVRVPGADAYTSTRLSADVIAALIEAGALDDLGPRLGLMMALRARDVPDVAVPDVEWGVLERSTRERQRLGVLLTEHPMVTLGDQVRGWQETGGRAAPLTKVAQLPFHAEVPVSIVGCVSSVEERPISTGLMVKVVIEDETGEVPVVLWPKTVRELGGTMSGLAQGRIIGISGKTRISEVYRPDGTDDDSDDEEPKVEIVGFRMFTGDLHDPDATIRPYSGPVLKPVRVDHRSPVLSVTPDVSTVAVAVQAPVLTVVPAPAATDGEPGPANTVTLRLRASTGSGDDSSSVTDRLLALATFENMSRFPALFGRSPLLTSVEAWWRTHARVVGSRTPPELWIPSAQGPKAQLVIEVAAETAFVAPSGVVVAA